MFDLVLKRGRVIDPAQNLARICDVAFAGVDPDAYPAIRPPTAAHDEKAAYVGAYAEGRGTPPIFSPRGDVSIAPVLKKEHRRGAEDAERS